MLPPSAWSHGNFRGRCEMSPLTCHLSAFFLLPVTHFSTAEQILGFLPYISISPLPGSEMHANICDDSNLSFLWEKCWGVPRHQIKTIKCLANQNSHPRKTRQNPKKTKKEILTPDFAYTQYIEFCEFSLFTLQFIWQLWYNLSLHSLHSFTKRMDPSPHFYLSVCMVK